MLHWLPLFFKLQGLVLGLAVSHSVVTTVLEFLFTISAGRYQWVWATRRLRPRPVLQHHWKLHLHLPGGLHASQWRQQLHGCVCFRPPSWHHAVAIFVSDLISCARRHEEELLLQELLLWQQDVWRRAELQHDQEDVLLLLQHRPRVEQTLWTVSCAQHRWGRTLAVYASTCMFMPKKQKWSSINSRLFIPAQMNLRSSVAVRDRDITSTSPLDGSSVRNAVLKVYVIKRKTWFTSYCLFPVC